MTDPVTNKTSLNNQHLWHTNKAVGIGKGRECKRKRDKTIKNNKSKKTLIAFTNFLLNESADPSSTPENKKKAGIQSVDPNKSTVSLPYENHEVFLKGKTIKGDNFIKMKLISPSNEKINISISERNGIADIKITVYSRSEFEKFQAENSTIHSIFTGSGIQINNLDIEYSESSSEGKTNIHNSSSPSPMNTKKNPGRSRAFSYQHLLGLGKELIG